MTFADHTPIDDDLLAELLAEDAAMAAGLHHSGSSYAPGGLEDADRTVSGSPPDLRECLRMLEQVWPRSGSEDGSGLGGGGASLPSPWKLGRFEVLHELGRGGFGIVYLAHDARLGRRVALKVPRPEVLLSESLRRQFLREARAAGKLDHPCIVPVFEAGEEGLLCYIASTYCVGPTLAAWLRSRPVPVPMRLAAKLVARMADAVRHAHDRNILHCDIKPSNVLLQQGPDPLDPADLVPRLTDFGLARLVSGPEPGADMTRSGVPVGSPPYMAPEQAAGRNRDLDCRTDVYALGATLYELLTGRPPFRGETITETLRLVLDTDPVAPRTLRPGLSRDLETVCMTCLRKDPARRYASASELAADLARFLVGEPIKARPVPAWERGLKWARRHPALASASGLAVVLALSLFAVGAWSNGVLLAHNEALRREALRADANARLTERYLHADRLRLARQALDLGQRERAQEILGDLSAKAGRAEPRGFVWHYLWGLARREVVLLGEHVRWGSFLTKSSDGTTLASYDTLGSLGRPPESFDFNGRIVLWNLPSEREKATVEARGAIEYGVTVSPDGSLVAAVVRPESAAGDLRRAMVWQTATGRACAEAQAPPGDRLESITMLSKGRFLVASTTPGSSGGLSVRLFQVAERVEAPRLLATIGEGVSFVRPSPDGNLLAVSGVSGRLELRESAGGARLRELAGGPAGEAASRAEFTGDARALLTVAGRNATFWDTSTGRPCAALVLDEPPINLAFGPDGATLAVLTSQKYVTLWHRDRGRIAEIKPDDEPNRERDVYLSLSPDGTRLVLASYGKIGVAMPVTLWNTADGKKVGDFPGRPRPVSYLEFLPDGCSVVVGGGGWPRTWRIPRPEIVPRGPLAGHADEGWAAAFSPDGRTLATGSDDTDEPKTLKIWDTATGRLRAGWKPHPATVSTLAFHPSGRLLATGGLCVKGNVRLWNPETGDLVKDLDGHTDKVRAVAFSPDGARLASAGSDRTIRIWDVATGETLHVLLGHTDNIRKLAFSPDGRTLASASNDRTARVWDAISGGPLRVIGGKQKFSAVVFTVDGATLAAADENGMITLLDPTTGDVRGVIPGDDAELRCLAVSPDGRNIAAAGAFRAVRVWDLVSRQELIRLDFHRQPVNALAFAPDGRTLASVSHDGAVMLWRAEGSP